MIFLAELAFKSDRLLVLLRVIQIRLLRDSMMYCRGKCLDRITVSKFATSNFFIYIDFNICSMRYGAVRILNGRNTLYPFQKKKNVP